MISDCTYAMALCVDSDLSEKAERAAKLRKLDYHKTKRKFIRQCRNYQFLRQSTVRMKKTCDVTVAYEKDLEPVIAAIEQNSGDPQYTGFTVKTLRNEKILVAMKTYQGPQAFDRPPTLLRVVSMELFFDFVIVQVHQYKVQQQSRSQFQLTFDDIARSLKSRLYFPTMWLSIFISLYEDSLPTKQAAPSQFFGEVVLDILPVTRDVFFSKVLICLDRFSGFIVLRPMTMAEDDKEEIGMELLKIFTDFNVPSIVKVRNVYYMTVIEMALKELSELFPGPSFTVQLESVKDSLHNLVEAEIQKEVLKNGRWAAACYLIQNRLNHQVAKNKGISPYDSVFPLPQRKKKIKKGDYVIDAKNIYTVKNGKVVVVDNATVKPVEDEAESNTIELNSSSDDERDTEKPTADFSLPIVTCVSSLCSESTELKTSSQQ